MFLRLRKLTAVLFVLISFGQSAPILQAATSSKPKLACACSHERSPCACDHSKSKKAKINQKQGCHHSQNRFAYRPKPCGDTTSDEVISFSSKPFLPIYVVSLTLNSNDLQYPFFVHSAVAHKTLPETPPPRL